MTTPDLRQGRVQPRVSRERALLGVRWPRWKDRVCAKQGHKPSSENGMGMTGGAYWPICTRCGRGVEPS